MIFLATYSVQCRDFKSFMPHSSFPLFLTVFSPVINTTYLHHHLNSFQQILFLMLVLLSCFSPLLSFPLFIFTSSFQSFSVSILTSLFFFSVPLLEFPSPPDSSYPFSTFFLPSPILPVSFCLIFSNVFCLESFGEQIVLNSQYYFTFSHVSSRTLVNILLSFSAAMLTNHLLLPLSQSCEGVRSVKAFVRGLDTECFEQFQKCVQADPRVKLVLKTEWKMQISESKIDDAICPSFCFSPLFCLRWCVYCPVLEDPQGAQARGV